jgi:hypothetical protein
VRLTGFLAVANVMRLFTQYFGRPLSAKGGAYAHNDLSALSKFSVPATTRVD